MAYSNPDRNPTKMLVCISASLSLSFSLSLWNARKARRGQFNIPVIINSRKYILLIVGIHLCPLVKLGHWSHRKVLFTKRRTSRTLDQAHNTLYQFRQRVQHLYYFTGTLLKHSLFFCLILFWLLNQCRVSHKCSL